MILISIDFCFSLILVSIKKVYRVDGWGFLSGAKKNMYVLNHC